MAGAKGRSDRFCGTRGNPPKSQNIGDGNSNGSGSAKPAYAPSSKHDPRHPIGTPNPITSQEEGQRLLDTGYHDGKQVYNVTDDGKIVKFQPDGTPANGYHSYEVLGHPDVPTGVLRKMKDDGKITEAQFKKLLKGQRGRGK